MKCLICDKNFKQTTEDQEVCPKCKLTDEELSNGKGDDEDD